MSPHPAARILGDGRDLLGESPLWDARDQSLYWVDTRRQLVQRGSSPAGAAWGQYGQYRHWQLPQAVGSIALAQPGTLLLALEDGFAMLDLTSGGVQPLAAVAHARSAMRLNDGRTDREGRFVCGAMVLQSSDPDAALYRLETDGRVSTLRGGIAVANSTCFSPDGRTMYSGDSLAGLIRAWDYAPDGQLSNERVFVDTRPDGSGPDGATVDAEGCVWVALVLAGRIARYAPDGRLLRSIELPVPYPTCPCFGGPDLGTLYVTSIRDSGHRLHSDAPEAGALVALTGLGVRGLPDVPYAGRQQR